MITLNEKICQVKDAIGNPCGRQTLGNRKCIFHLSLEEKRVFEDGKFEEEFWNEFNRMETNDDIKKLDFSNFIFPNPINFRGHEFKKKVYFIKAKFIKNADFGEAQFGDVANFGEAQFGGIANFDNAQFSNKARADFGVAQFSKMANFIRAKFGFADFRGAEFSDIVVFRDAQFNNIAYFNRTEFMSEVVFIDTKFNDKYLIIFNYGRFHKPKYVRFQNVNLSTVSFSYTDISEVEFLNEKWETKNGRLTLVDESRIIKDKAITYDAVAQLYRRLRRNYEDNYRFAEAGDFFIGEMEMRRLNVNTEFKDERLKKIELLFKRNFSLLGVYKRLSLYGESYWRTAILCLLVIVFYPTTVDFYFRLRYNTPFFENLPGYPIRESFASFFQLDNTFLVERLIGLILLGLLLIALKRKFERRK